MARTFTAGQRTAIGATGVAHALKLEVEDPDGTYRDLSTYFSAGDYVVDFRLEKTIDANCWTMRATLLRDDGSTASLAPLREDSDLNVDSMAAYAPFLDVGRKWRASVSVQSVGTAHSYTVLCEGHIDTVVVNDPEPTITLTGRDLGASLLDRWIDTEREYGAYQEFSNTDWGAVTITDSGVTATFASGTLETDGIEPGWFVKFSNLSVGGNNDVWVRIESVDSETVLTLASGGLADNASDAAWSVEVAKNMETVLQELLDDNLTSAPTLEVHTSPSFLMNPYTQQKESLMTALNTVAQKAGMTVSYRYDASNNFKVTLWAPDRTATAGDEVWSVGPSEYTALRTAEIDIAGVRNKVILSYYDGSSITTHTETDATSVARYGGDHAIPRVLEIDLGADAQIVTSTRANTLAEAILSDLKDPPFQQAFEIPGFWIADIGDFGKFLANTTHYDTDQYGGVTEIVHEFSDGVLMTTLQVRGQPSARYREWHRQNKNIVADPPTLEVALFDMVFTASDADTVAWTSGTLTLADGTDYAISSGNTGTMAAATYIYFDPAISTTELRTATSVTAVGKRKALLGVAQNVAEATKDAEFQVFGGKGGVNKLWTGDSIAADTITADHISVATLSAVTSELGTVNIQADAYDILFLHSGNQIGQINATSLALTAHFGVNSVNYEVQKEGGAGTATLETLWIEDDGDGGGVYGHGAMDGGVLDWDGDGAFFAGWVDVGDDLAVAGDLSVAGNVTGTITHTGALITAATAVGGAKFRLPHGTAPDTPTDGDMWTTTAGLYVRINGSTVGPLS